MSLKWQQFTPQKIQIEKMNGVLVDLMDGVADVMDGAFADTVADWDEPAEFEKTIESTPKELSATVATDNQIYKYLNDGTKKNYPIEPKNPDGVLSFLEFYDAKTQPGQTYSTPGGAHGDRVFAKAVIHPGIKARKFDKNIKKEITPELREMAGDALVDVARISGHWFRR